MRTVYYLFISAFFTIFCIHLIYILIIDGVIYLIACHYSLISLFSVVFCVLLYVANELFSIILDFFLPNQVRSG